MTELGNLDRSLRGLSGDVAKMQRPVDRAHAAAAATKSALAKVQPPIIKTKSALDRAQALLQGWLAMTAEINRRYERSPPEHVETVCAGINCALAPEIKAIAEKGAPLKKSLDSTSQAFEGVIKASKAVTDAIEAADDLMRSLRPLEGPLNALKKALRPVRWALNAVSWVTGKVIDPIVNEILKTVGLN